MYQMTINQERIDRAIDLLVNRTMDGWQWSLLTVYCVDPDEGLMVGFRHGGEMYPMNEAEAAIVARRLDELGDETDDRFLIMAAYSLRATMGSMNEEEAEITLKH